MIVGDHCVKESMGVGLRVRGVEGIGDEMQLHPKIECSPRHASTTPPMSWGTRDHVVGNNEKNTGVPHDNPPHVVECKFPTTCFHDMLDLVHDTPPRQGPHDRVCSTTGCPELALGRQGTSAPRQGNPIPHDTLFSMSWSTRACRGGVSWSAKKPVSWRYVVGTHTHTHTHTCERNLTISI